jgi:hypothetical protein
MAGYLLLIIIIIIIVVACWFVETQIIIIVCTEQKVFNVKIMCVCVFFFQRGGRIGVCETYRK